MLTHGYLYHYAINRVGDCRLGLPSAHTNSNLLWIVPAIVPHMPRSVHLQSMTSTYVVFIAQTLSESPTLHPTRKQLVPQNWLGSGTRTTLILVALYSRSGIFKPPIPSWRGSIKSWQVQAQRPSSEPMATGLPTRLISSTSRS